MTARAVISVPRRTGPAGDGDGHLVGRCRKGPGDSLSNVARPSTRWVADILDWEWVPDAYDMVVAVFIQFLDPQQRSVVFEGFERTLRPGGRLLLHGYRPEQVNNGTGGPSDPAHMYSEALLTDVFAGFEIERLKSYDTTIEEGAGHHGTSALIDFIATKG